MIAGEPGLDGRPRGELLDLFARHLYGPIPPPPDTVAVRRLPVRGESCERLVIGLTVGDGRLGVDAALWLPQAPKPVPVIVGLDFLGPIGVLRGNGLPIDTGAVLDVGDERMLDDGLRGQHADRWPVDLILDAGFGLLVSCYGSWAHDRPSSWCDHGLSPLLRPQPATGALSLWAWALSRLIDVAGRCPEIDPARIHLAGHSRLGKAALWAAANDERAAGVVVNNSGCAGASLSRHDAGETLRDLAGCYPHWLSPAATLDPDLLPIDQHQLLACVAPRRLYVASAVDDLWADPQGEYLALRAAAPAWGAALPSLDSAWSPGSRLVSGPVAWHLRPGGHGLTEWDWQRFLPHLAAEQQGLTRRSAPRHTTRR